MALEPAHYSARHASCRRGWLERPCVWLRAVLRCRWIGREGAASSRRLAALTTLTGEPRRLASGSGISRGSATSRCGDACEGSRAIGSTPAQTRNRTAHMALSPYRTVNRLSGGVAQSTGPLLEAGFRFMESLAPTKTAPYDLSISKQDHCSIQMM